MIIFPSLIVRCKEWHKCHSLSPKELIVTLDWFLTWHRVSWIQLDTLKLLVCLQVVKNLPNSLFKVFLSRQRIAQHFFFFFLYYLTGLGLYRKIRTWKLPSAWSPQWIRVFSLKQPHPFQQCSFGGRERAWHALFNSYDYGITSWWGWAG